MSISISLNSFMKGGKTRIEMLNIMNEIHTRTINKDINLGSFKPICIWLHKLQTTFDITNEQIIKSIKSLRVHIIKKVIITKANLK